MSHSEVLACQEKQGFEYFFNQLLVLTDTPKLIQ